MKHAHGYTLPEVMIVVAIVGILGAVVFPAYQDSVRKSRRAEATSALLQLAQNLERCFTINGSYLRDPIAGNPEECIVPAGAGATTETTPGGTYLLTVSNRTQMTYTLTATPIMTGAQKGDAGKCSSFTLTQSGVKDSAGSSKPCW